MLEKKLFHEIPGGKSTFHSAILTSYSFNFHHFEYQVLKDLRKKWISCVLVLVDQAMQEGILGISSDNLKQLSQSYSVVGISSKGAFHPKINFLIGDEKILVFLGSGNITPGGHGKNHELFTGFLIDKGDSVQLPLIAETWGYIKTISKDLKGYSENLIQNVIPKTNKFFDYHIDVKHVFKRLDESTEIALLYNEVGSNIFQQLTNLIPKNGIIQISIFCPYYDENGETLINLQRHFHYSKIDVYLPEKFGLPPINMALDGSIRFFKWEETLRGKKAIAGKVSYLRKMHCKIFHFISDDSDYFLMGSANATINAFGSQTKPSINEEFCVLYKLKDKGFMDLLGLSGSKEPISIEGYSRTDKIELAGDYRVENYIKILCVDLNGYNIKMFYCAKRVPAFSYLALYDCSGQCIHYTEIDLKGISPIQIQLNDEILMKNPSYVVIENKDKKAISNKQLINIVDKLINTDPSKGNRKILQILNAIEGGNINEFEIIEYVNNLNKSFNTKIKSKTIQISVNEDNTRDGSVSLDLTYEEAVSRSMASKDHIHHHRNFSSTRFWQLISQLFQEKLISNNEDLSDEEEEADASKSHYRNLSKDDNEPVKFKNQSSFKSKIAHLERMSRDYHIVLKKIISSQNYQIDEFDLSQFLLVTHLITVVCNFTEFKIENETDKEDQPIGYIDWKKYLKIQYSDLMLEVLSDFVKLRKKFDLKEYDIDEYQNGKVLDFNRKTIYHFWVYLYFLKRNNSNAAIDEKIELIGLNSLKYMGSPDVDFQAYIKNMSSSYNNIYFNPIGVVRFCESIDRIKKEIPISKNYLSLDHSGICKIIEINTNDVIYRSLYGLKRISKARYIKAKY